MNGHQLVLHKIKESKLTATLVRKIFNYDPKTGWLTWAVDSRNVKGQGRGGNRRKDKRAGTLGYVRHRGRTSINKYRRVQLGKHIYAEHRLIWLHVHGKLPKWPLVLDHVNGDGTDNRLANLRVATRGQNVINTERRTGTKSVWLQKNGKWSVTLHIGGFKTHKDASLFAYNTMKQFHGEFVNPEHYGLIKTAVNGEQPDVS